MEQYPINNPPNEIKINKIEMSGLCSKLSSELIYLDSPEFVAIKPSNVCAKCAIIYGDSLSLRIIGRYKSK